MFDRDKCSVPGRDSGQHSTRVTEPEEGETGANRTERNGFGEKDDEGVRVCILCARVREYERFGSDTQPWLLKLDTCCGPCSTPYRLPRKKNKMMCDQQVS